MDDEDDISFVMEDNKIIKNSMIPLVDNASIEFKTIFCEAKKKVVSANNILQRHGKDNDYQVEALFNIDLNSWNDYSPEKMYEMIQSFADQTNAAKREAARFSEENMNLKSRFSSNEMANKRLTSCVDELENRTMTLLDKVKKEENIRINLIRELKESNERLTRERRNLEHEVIDARKNIHELQIEKQRSETQRRKFETDNVLVENRAKQAEAECIKLKEQFAKASKNANESRAEWMKAQNLADTLKNDLENQIHHNQINQERNEREVKRIFTERDNALDHQKKSFEKEIAQLHAGYSDVLKNNKKFAQEAIARSAQEAANAIKSQKDYYKLYNELKTNLETYKKQYEEKIQTQILSKIAHGFTVDQVNKLRTQNSIRPIRTTANFSERALNILESTSSSSSSLLENENLPPKTNQRQNQQQQQQQLKGTRQVARSYSLIGRFPTTKRS